MELCAVGFVKFTVSPQVYPAEDDEYKSIFDQLLDGYSGGTVSAEILRASSDYRRETIFFPSHTELPQDDVYSLDEWQELYQSSDPGDSPKAYGKVLSQGQARFWQECRKPTIDPLLCEMFELEPFSGELRSKFIPKISGNNSSEYTSLQHEFGGDFLQRAVAVHSSDLPGNLYRYNSNTLLLPPGVLLLMEVAQLQEGSQQIAAQFTGTQFRKVKNRGAMLARQFNWVDVSWNTNDYASDSLAPDGLTLSLRRVSCMREITRSRNELYFRHSLKTGHSHLDTFECTICGSPNVSARIESAKVSNHTIGTCSNQCMVVAADAVGQILSGQRKKASVLARVKLSPLVDLAGTNEAEFSELRWLLFLLFCGKSGHPETRRLDSLRAKRGGSRKMCEFTEEQHYSSQPLYMDQDTLMKLRREGIVAVKDPAALKSVPVAELRLEGESVTLTRVKPPQGCPQSLVYYSDPGKIPQRACIFTQDLKTALISEDSALLPVNEPAPYAKGWEVVRR